MFGMYNNDLIDLNSITADQVESLLNLAQKMKNKEDNKKYLLDKNIGLLFSNPSTRTRISFQVGINSLGGNAEFYKASDLQLENHEDLKDTANVMGRYLDALIVRMYDMNYYGQARKNLITLAKNMDIPVINALDDKEHPCQVLSDLLTMKELYKDEFKKKRLVFTWGYSKRKKSLGVPHSMMTVGALLGMNIVFTYPKGYELEEDYIERAKELSKKSGATIEFSNNLLEATEGADMIYQKNWKGIHMSTEDDTILREEIKADWCVNSECFSCANKDAVYMDCLPTIRGEGVSAEILDGKHSIIYDQAENRLHMQKAIIASLLHE